MKNPNYKTYILPDDVKSVKGMVSNYERTYLNFYTSKLYTGQGTIVDLGCWLGATSLALATGLEQNKCFRSDKKYIYSYDLFKWDLSYNPHVIDCKNEYVFNNGDCFIEKYKKNLNRYLKNISIHKDIIEEGWHNEKIEFLLIDAMKNLTLTKSILNNFYPFLIPNKSLIYHQDFDHYLTPWVHLLIYLHKPFCKLTHNVPYSGGCVFLIKKPIPEKLLNIDFGKLDEKTVDTAFHYCLNIADKNKYKGIASAHVYFYYYNKKIDKAKQVLIKYLWNGIEIENDLIKRIFA